MGTGSGQIEIFTECEAASGSMNMAIDEALLERAIDCHTGHFRWYRWSRPTISLGYFQEHNPEAVPETMQSLDVVRRLTGGGAILHHRELTYSCSLPPDHAWSQDPSQLYRDLHEIIRAALYSQGFECEFRGVPKTFTSGEPFLCYARGDERDLVVGQDKVVGSAQRRRKGALLQHGSILLNRSEYAPQFPGLDDLAASQHAVDPISLCEDILEETFRLFENAKKSIRPETGIRERSESLVREKYQYTGRRFEPPPDKRSKLQK